MKKVLSVLLIMLLLICSTVTAFAANDETPVILSIDTVLGKVGDTVSIPVSIKNFHISGLKDMTSCLDILITYNADELEVLSVAPGDVVRDSDNSFASIIDAGEITILHADQSGILGNFITNDGVYAWITVFIKNTPVKNISELKIDRIYGINDGSYNPIEYPVKIINGGIEIITDAPVIGDLDGDGSVNSTDLAWLKRYILGTISNFPFDEAIADINGDGKINSTDYAALKRLILNISD